MISLSRRQTTFLAIALVALLLITIVLAPGSGSANQRGSTYSRAPSGYGAWYAFMQERGTAIQRWQKPVDLLFDPGSEAAKSYTPPGGKLSLPTSPITLVRISNGLDPLASGDRWVRQGNTMVLLGVRSRATDAPFTTDIQSAVGSVRIETSRRYLSTDKAESTNKAEKSPSRPDNLLQDSFGAVVWQESLGKGRIIYATTPHLAANAYQDQRPNYEFLAKLVTEPGHPIWVDEFMHGYRDPVTGEGAPEDNLLAYLLKTPLSLVLIQAAVILLVLIWGQNRRLGPPTPLPTGAIDNSEAYIQALAGVLEKAGCSEFVLDVVGKAEQLEIQKALGLGSTLLPLATLTEAWTRQTGYPADHLKTLLQTAAQGRRVSQPDLLKWVETVQTVRGRLQETTGASRSQ